MSETPRVEHILEAALLAAGRALSITQLESLFSDDAQPPDRLRIREALQSLAQHYAGRGIELVEVASGFRLQSAASVAPWLGRLFEERAPRYSRALLETLVLIAYRQPITRGEIEDVRGVAVSSNIIRTLQERDWIKVVAHKEVPGRPAMLGTTRQFLDYFNLKRLEDLPPLSALTDLDAFDAVLAEEMGIVSPAMQGDAANDEREPATQDADRGPGALEENDRTASLSRLEAGSSGGDGLPDMSASEHSDGDARAATQSDLQRVVSAFTSEHRVATEKQADRSHPAAAEPAVGAPVQHAEKPSAGTVKPVRQYSTHPANPRETLH